MRTTFDIAALRMIVAGAELGSFARAAARLGRSQSAVSMQLKKLEEQTGKALFRRSGRGLVPTEAGDALLAYARRIIALNDEAAASLGAIPAATVRLGLPQDFAEDVLPEHNVGARHSIDQTAVHHRSRTRPDLLGWLEERDERPRPRAGLRGEQRGGSDQARDVHVVAARVHQADGAARLVDGGVARGVGQAGLLGDREPVHVRAAEHHRAGAVVEDPHDASAEGVHLVAELAQTGGDKSSGLLLVKAQLRVGVQVQVELLLPAARGTQPTEHLVQ